MANCRRYSFGCIGRSLFRAHLGSSWRFPIPCNLKSKMAPFFISGDCWLLIAIFVSALKSILEDNRKKSMRQPSNMLEVVLDPLKPRIACQDASPLMEMWNGRYGLQTVRFRTLFQSFGALRLWLDISWSNNLERKLPVDIIHDW